MPISAIAEMPLRDFFGYWTHSLRYMMPSQRQEVYLAQVSYLVAATMGSYKGSVEDFILFKQAENKKSSAKKAKKPKRAASGADPFKNFSAANKKR